jgi:hypothetical protein
MYKSIQNIYKLLLIFFNILLISVLFSIYKIKISLYLGFFLIFIFQIFLILKYLNFNFYRMLEKILIAKIISLFIFIYSNNTLCKSNFNIYIENTYLSDKVSVPVSAVLFAFCFFSLVHYAIDYRIVLENKAINYLSIYESSSKIIYDAWIKNLNFVNMLSRKDLDLLLFKKLKMREYVEINKDLNLLNLFWDKVTYPQFRSLVNFVLFVDRKDFSNISNDIIFVVSKKLHKHCTINSFVNIPKKTTFQYIADFFIYDILHSYEVLLPILMLCYVGRLFFGPNFFSTFNYDYFYNRKKNYIVYEELIRDYQIFYDTYKNKNLDINFIWQNIDFDIENIEEVD